MRSRSLAVVARPSACVAVAALAVTLAACAGASKPVPPPAPEQAALPPTVDLWSPAAQGGVVGGLGGQAAFAVVDRDAYLTAFSVDRMGRVRVLYPATPRGDQRVRAGAPVTLNAWMAADPQFQFAVGNNTRLVPFVFAVASREPLDLRMFGEGKRWSRQVRLDQQGWMPESIIEVLSDSLRASPRTATADYVFLGPRLPLRTQYALALCRTLAPQDGRDYWYFRDLWAVFDPNDGRSARRRPPASATQRRASASACTRCGSSARRGRRASSAAARLPRPAARAARQRGVASAALRHGAARGAGGERAEADAGGPLAGGPRPFRPPVERVESIELRLSTGEDESSRAARGRGERTSTAEQTALAEGPTGERAERVAERVTRAGRAPGGFRLEGADEAGAPDARAFRTEPLERLEQGARTGDHGSERGARAWAERGADIEEDVAWRAGSSGRLVGSGTPDMGASSRAASAESGGAGTAPPPSAASAAPRSESSGSGGAARVRPVVDPER
jgi:hypothetical protein